MFPCADISVFPSIIPEAYPLVLMESLSNGVLPVVTYFSGFKDGIDELKVYLGKSITDRMKISADIHKRIKSIISNINALLSNPDLRKSSNELHQIAASNYDWKLRASQMIEAYTSLIQERQ